MIVRLPQQRRRHVGPTGSAKLDLATPSPTHKLTLVKCSHGQSPANLYTSLARMNHEMYENRGQKHPRSSSYMAKSRVDPRDAVRAIQLIFVRHANWFITSKEFGIITMNMWSPHTVLRILPCPFLLRAKLNRRI